MRWSLTDLTAATTTVHRQIVRERNVADPGTGVRRGRLVEKSTKRDASRATLSLPAALVEVLREHRAQQLRDRMAAKVWLDPDLVFTTNVGSMLEPRNIHRAWAVVCKRAGVRALHVHDLRHAAASLAFAAGASIKEVQGMLRQARQATTADIRYEVYDSVRRGTADRMDGVMRRLGGVG